MATKKELGGKRLGSGSKINVKLHGFNRSSHDQGKIFKTAQSAGTLIPAYCNIGLNGTDFYIDLASKIRTLPTNGPIFGQFKHQIDVFQIPIRLYIAALHNNALNIGRNMSKVKLPMNEYIVQKIDPSFRDPNASQVAQDSLTAYLGIRGLGNKTVDMEVKREFPAIFELAYWDIYKNYYSNKQEEIGYVITGETGPESGIILSGLTFGDDNSLESPEALFKENEGGTVLYVSQVGVVSTKNEQQGIPISISLVDGFNGMSAAEIYDALKNILIRPDDTKEPESWVTLESLVEPRVAPRWNADTQVLSLSLAPKKKIAWTIEGSRVVKKVATTKDVVLKEFPLSNIDDMRELILAAPKTTPFYPSRQNILPYAATTGIAGTTNMKEPTGNACFFEQAGLGIKTYMSDRFNNWLNAEWIDGNNGINEITAVQVVDGKISMDSLILAKKMYNMLNRIAIGDGTYNDWQEVTYDETSVRMAESPIYEGGMSSIISFDEVVATADTTTNEGDNVPLGSLAGRGSDGRSKGGRSLHVHCTEPCMLMVIESITPILDYSQGNKWWNVLRTMDDFHKPGLDGIGFQELTTEEMAAWDTVVDRDGATTKFSAGKQTPWIQYQTETNEAFGDFSAGHELDYMAMTRAYERGADGRVKDLTTYIDPKKWNRAFADAKLSAKNFWVQIAIDVTARRKMSASQIPNL